MVEVSTFNSCERGIGGIAALKIVSVFAYLTLCLTAPGYDHRPRLVTVESLGTSYPVLVNNRAASFQPINRLFRLWHFAFHTLWIRPDWTGAWSGSHA